MKKILKKCQIWLCILLLIFGAISKPKTAKADAGVLTGGMALASVSGPALPVVLIGLAAVLLLGYTITNWDDIKAFGHAVVQELNAMGYTIADFVVGSSVKIDGNFKTAVKNAANNTGDSLPKYQKTAEYVGGLMITTGDVVSKVTGSTLVLGSGVSGDISKLYLGTDIPTGFFSPYRYIKGKDYLLPEITVIVDVAPTDLDLKLSGSNTSIIRNSQGQIVQLIGEYSNIKRATGYFSVYISSPVNSPYRIESLTVPQLGIGERANDRVSVDNMKVGAVDSKKIDDYMDTAFPSTTSVTFNTQADLTDVTLATVPTVSDHTLSDVQVKKLVDIRTGVDTAVDSGVDARVDSTTGASTGTNTGAGWDWLSKLWEWLKKLLDAILGLPASILSGLQSLWDSLIKWLTDIWTAITAIPGAISKAWTDALTWAFGVDQVWLDAKLKNLRLAFNRKFPNIQAFNYRFSDKSAFDDIRITLPGFGTHSVVSGKVMTAFAVKTKPFISGVFYLLTALFFMRKFYKVSED